MSKEIVEKRLEINGLDDVTTSNAAAIDFIKQELHEYIETERISFLQYFQEAILEKFGFIRNAAIVKTFDPKDPRDEESVHFIHATGGMFVLIPNYSSSYLGIRSRHSSANTAASTGATGTTPKSKETHLTSSSFEESLINKLNTTTAAQSTNILTKLDTINENQALIEASSSSLVSATSASFTNTISTSNINETMTHPSSLNTITNQSKRDRSNSKSQQLEFLRLNKNYLNEKSEINETTSSLSSSLLNDFDLMPPPSNCFSTSSSSLLHSATPPQQIPPCPPPSPPPPPSHSNQSDTIFTTYDENTKSSSNNLKDLMSVDGLFRSKPFYDENEGCFVGFLWSWNFMLGKKWRSQFTGDESFQDNMLADFRLFCSNQDGRLAAFFAECKNLLKS